MNTESEAKQIRMCGNGHQITDDNTYRYRNKRKCRQCNTDRVARWYGRNRDQGCADRKARYAANKETILAKGRKKKYGSDFDYDALLVNQGGICAVPNCGNDGSETKRGVLYVDHCHTTGVVRSLLCAGCNTALGHVKEDAKRLIGLAEYVEKWNALKSNYPKAGS